MPRTIQQTVTFRVPPDQLFDTYLSSRKHTVVTGAKAVMTRAVGAKFMAHAGHLRGRNLAIVSKRLIVQSWRGSNWKKRDLDSILVLAARGIPTRLKGSSRCWGHATDRGSGRSACQPPCTATGCCRPKRGARTPTTYRDGL